MLAFDFLLVLTAVGGLLAVVFWVRVASSRSLSEIFKLDGAEKLAERGNRRAFTIALIASVLTVLLAAAAYLVGSNVGAL